MSWPARNSVSVTDAAAALAEGASLIDVRTDAEWTERRPAGARHIPMNALAGKAKTLNGKRVLVICRSGSRSRRAAAMLRRAGVDATNVRGGILSWERHGLAIERNNPKRTQSSRKRRTR